jgi:hypothetical protein
MYSLYCLFLFAVAAIAGKDYYKILGVKKTAKAAEIKKAYRSVRSTAVTIAFLHSSRQINLNFHYPYDF